MTDVGLRMLALLVMISSLTITMGPVDGKVAVAWPCVANVVGLGEVLVLTAAILIL